MPPHRSSRTLHGAAVTRRRALAATALLLSAATGCFVYAPLHSTPRPTASSGRGPIVRVTYAPPRTLQTTGDGGAGTLVERLEGRVVARGPGDTLTLDLMAVAAPGGMLRLVEGVRGARAAPPLRVAPAPGVAVEEYRFSSLNTATLAVTIALAIAAFAYVLSQAFGND